MNGRMILNVQKRVEGSLPEQKDKLGVKEEMKVMVENVTANIPGLFTAPRLFLVQVLLSAVHKITLND